MEPNDTRIPALLTRRWKVPGAVVDKAGLAINWMVQHGGLAVAGGDAQGVFKNWAFE